MQLNPTAEIGSGLGLAATAAGGAIALRAANKLTSALGKGKGKGKGKTKGKRKDKRKRLVRA